MDCCSGSVAKCPENDDSNFDHGTQMLPECFVRVKIENSEDCCEKLNCPTPQSSDVISYSAASHFYNKQNLNVSIMQNLQQHSMNSGCGGPPPPHCFHHHHHHHHHHRGSAGCSGLPELPPWLSHCYTTQMAPDCAQQVAQHFHSQSTYLTHEGAIGPEGERFLKGGSGNRCDNSSGIGGLTSGDICDSNTFLSYVLNPRSGSIFLFDSTRSTHINELPDSIGSLNGHTNISADESDQHNHTAPIPKHAPSLAGNDDNISSDTSHTNHKVCHSPCTVLPSERRLESSSDSCNNTASKYSQTLSSISLHQDARTNTRDDVDSNSSVSNSSKVDKYISNHSSKCTLGNSVNEECDNEQSTVKTVANFCSKCDFISHSELHYPNSCCPKMCTSSENRIDNINVDSNFRTADSTHLQGACHNLCYNCTVSNRDIDPNIKSGSLVNHCYNGINKVGNNFQRGSIPMCKAMKDCDSMCIKNNRRMHYIDIDRPYTCEICLKNYPSSAALINHTRYHRGERPYQCEICNKAFATNSHLVTHRRVHTGERPFQCQLCRRSFADRSAFVKHERTHGPNGTIIKRYKCEECGNAFVDSCGLKKHIRIHTGERPYRCSICEKTFSTSSTFVAHKRIHSGERPYKCEQCNKMFITKSHLLTHRRTHTGEKPFTCHVCSRSFADGSSFRRHERLHTGENRHTCDVCGKGFPLDTSLAKHKQSHIPGTATYVYMV